MSERLYNVNIGVLGHVDSGKTSIGKRKKSSQSIAVMNYYSQYIRSLYFILFRTFINIISINCLNLIRVLPDFILVAALSTTLSTAALDKHPQSRQRGITLDLGFSSFQLPATTEIANSGYTGIQVTLVDCPGHASLIKTVIGGAHIIDAMILVVDVTKGIQPQTAECIVLGEITVKKAVVVLNKIDLIPLKYREKYIKKARGMISKTLETTQFAGCPVVEFTAIPFTNQPSEGNVASLNARSNELQNNAIKTDNHEFDLYEFSVDNLKSVIQSLVSVRPKRSKDSDEFLFYIDHCFAVKGHGTVLTGTVAVGNIRVGNIIEIPALRIERKVKSMQMFHKPVTRIQQGDRAGICVTNLDAKLVERGLACSPKTVPSYNMAIASVRKIRFYAGPVSSGSKLHVIMGHQVAMARLTFFKSNQNKRHEGVQQSDDSNKASKPTQSIISKTFGSESKWLVRADLNGHGKAFDFSKDYLYLDELPQGSNCDVEYWALIQFEDTIIAPGDALIVGARLDADLHIGTCRLALSGSVAASLPPQDDMRQLSHVRVYKEKIREGVIDRIDFGSSRAANSTQEESCVAICRGMFSKDSNLTRFLGAHIEGPAGMDGVLDSIFGQSGKFRVRFNQTLSRKYLGQKISLKYKKYLFDSKDAKASKIQQ